ncbi:MAG: amino acid dehydrogenase [Bacteroidetes bacterium MedPE-SWsnd-G2]|nr:MAG: amino acid dehydrogenase [Bacteroidetes bacterium MedPE-SWsnd-G2]
MQKEVVVIGGGIIGLCSAYYLLKEGHKVTVLEQSDFTKGASFVNAGYITPSHFIPLAAPGMISKGIKWMFDSTSPFYVKPRLNSAFLSWAWNFNKSSTHKKVERAIPVIKDINLLSRALYEEMKEANEFPFHYDHKGLLMFYKTEKAGEEEWQVGMRGLKEGLKVENLSFSEAQKLEPNISADVKGAVYYKSDAHMTPGVFMTGMAEYLKSNGVTILLNETVKDLGLNQNKIESVQTNKREIKGDEFVLSTGSWSPILAKKIGLNLAVEAGKGYRINTRSSTGIKLPGILVEAKVAVTPMQGFTRFAGTMELGGLNEKINPVRVGAIAKAAQDYYNSVNLSRQEIQNAECGLRPCTPDGIPYIGKSNTCQNLTIATGHAMMGWSLGPATGKIVAQIIGEQKTELDILPFHPDRKF